MEFNGPSSNGSPFFQEKLEHWQRKREVLFNFFLSRAPLGQSVNGPERLLNVSAVRVPVYDFLSVLSLQKILPLEPRWLTNRQACELVKLIVRGECGVCVSSEDPPLLKGASIRDFRRCPSRPRCVLPSGSCAETDGRVISGAAALDGTAASKEMDHVLPLKVVCVAGIFPVEQDCQVRTPLSHQSDKQRANVPDPRGRACPSKLSLPQAPP